MLAEWSYRTDPNNIRSTTGRVPNDINQLARLATTESRFADEAEAAVADHPAVAAAHRSAMKKTVGA